MTAPAEAQGKAVTMHTNLTNVRCTTCGSLLAKRGENGLTVRRGELQATIDGDCHVSLVCYRCRSLNVLRLSASQPKDRAAS